MGRVFAAIDEADLERALLRKSVGALTSGTQRCADCGRTPLIGESVHVYDDGRVYCDLCRPHRREEPIRCERVRGDYGHAVKLTVRAA